MSVITEAPPAPRSSASRMAEHETDILGLLDSFPDNDPAEPTPAPETPDPKPAAPEPKPAADAEETEEDEDETEEGESEETPPKEGEPPQKLSRYKQFRLKQEEKITALKAEYEAKLAALENEKLSKEERLKSAEALKEKLELTAKELEEQIVSTRHQPYSIDIDPEAQPVLIARKDAMEALDDAIATAAAEMSDDPRTVAAIAQSRRVFSELMVKMAREQAPNAAYAAELVEAFRKNGIEIDPDEAKAAVRGLRSSLPHVKALGKHQHTLAMLQEKNEPNWTRDQAARHEAVRREIAKAADVPEDAKEGDAAILAAILKADPEMKTRLEQEKERVSAAILGPPPGAATAGKVKASERALKEAAMRTAHIPLLVTEVKARGEKIATLEARVKELEGRITDTTAAVPRPAGSAAAVAKSTVKRSAAEQIAEAMGLPAF